MAVRDVDNPHYYWYETLQRSNEENWYNKLKSHLEKVDTYEEWYGKYKSLFSGPTRAPVYIIQNVAQYAPIDQYGLAISIQLAYPASEILESVKNLLKEHQTTHRRRPEFDDWADVFELASQPDCPTLKILLDVYDLLNVADDVKPTLYEVGVQLKLSPKSVITSDDTPKDIRDKTTAMNSLVSRYHRWSRELIANAEEGFFPVYGTIKKPKRNEHGFFIHN